MVLIALTATATTATATTTTQVRRYLLSAGVNNGGTDRVMLRYAVSDATAFASVLTDMGGVERKNAIVLSDPSSRELLGGLINLGKLMAKDRAATPNIRGEVFVYYSGHADENGLKLGTETLSWSDFRNAVSRLEADVRVAVLDACGSGAITRAKGGVAQPAFLSDASSNMKGYAFITSSNENESSQESDRIRGSYFTHALLSGMRGAADMTGDGKVTINEAYQYAFNETLQNTQNTRAGTQHPSRDMNLAGTGDVVMTDLHETSATLSLDINLEGRFFIRDGNGNLFAELRKFRGRAIELGMPPGKYSIEMEAPSRMWMSGGVEIVAGKKTALSMNDMKAMARKVTVSRGNDNIVLTNPLLDSACREPWRMNFGSIASAGNAKPERGFQLSLFANIADAEFCGTQLSSIVNIAKKDMSGAQINPIVNIALERFNGTQVSTINLMNSGDKAVQTGAINIAKDVGYVQAGAINIAKDVGYVQGGAINIAKDVGYVQGGAVNIAKDVGYVQAGATNIAANAKFQAGAVNIAKTTSRQIGVLNIAAHSEKTPVGLLNIIGNGIFELSYYMETDNLMALSAHTGTPWLYSLIEYAQPIGSLDRLPKAQAFGLGTRFGTTGPFYANLDLLHFAFFDDSFAFFDNSDGIPMLDNTSDTTITTRTNANSLLKLRAGVNYAPIRYAAIFGGAYLNCLIADEYGNFNITDPDPNKPGAGTSVDPPNKGDEKPQFGKHETKVRVWPGLYAGITVGISRWQK
jgi:hypothetical protein